MNDPIRARLDEIDWHCGAGAPCNLTVDALRAVLDLCDEATDSFDIEHLPTDIHRAIAKKIGVEQ